MSKRCDDTDDCGDGSDESTCGNKNQCQFCLVLDLTFQDNFSSG